MMLLPPPRLRLARLRSRFGPLLALLAFACTSVPPATRPIAVATVAAAPAEVLVPDLRGLSLNEARERLRAAGLLAGTAEVTTAPAGMVWHQSLPSGSLVAAGTPIDLEVVEQASSPGGCPTPDLSTLCSALPLRSRRPQPWRHGAHLGPPRVPASQLSP